MSSRALIPPLFLLSLAAATLQNPVLPGDHPDPSIIRFGGAYWAANTSSEWAPIFPLHSSNDLVHWTLQTSVFTDPPAWAETWFWAPELYTENNRVRVYYSAQKHNGPLCVAVATADRPAGPYTDHGPLVCRQEGAIDAFFTRDAAGHPYLLWKQNGSAAAPSAIFAQPTTDDGLHLTGSPREVIRSDVPWEGRDVEAPDIVRHGDYLYLLYAGGFCCGPNCSYGEGVARAKSMTGPWEKNPANPIVTSSAAWRCPGHGTEVTAADGTEYFLYHAYSKRNFLATGREAVLDRLTWKDGWPVIGAGNGPGPESAAPPPPAHDAFQSTTLQPSWQWPLWQKPAARVGGGTLLLASTPATTGFLGGMLARPLETPDYTVETELLPGSLAQGAAAGLAILADRQTAAGIALQNGRIIQWRIDGGKWTKLADQAAPAGDRVRLRIETRGPRRFQTMYAKAGGNFEVAGSILDTASLPPWDRDLRVALFAGGGTSGARFTSFDLRYGAP